ncbi:MAG: glycosyltransferase family 4 protein [Gammaproteobacteria bacterium]|nr:glycosyltransferase family 4 protein [Gammaproteobacteria bacterium]
MRILFSFGYQHDFINKTYWQRHGLGGSEYAMMKLAEQFADHGHDVTVTGKVGDEVIAGVKFIDYSKLAHNQHFDVVVANNYIHYVPLFDEMNITYKQSYFWLHNFDFYAWWRRKALPNEGRDVLNDPRITAFVAVSEYQKQKLETLYPAMQGRIVVLNNATDPRDFDRINVRRVPGKFVYSSSPERGLERLLTAWPKIQAQLPHATLTVTTPPYAMKWYDRFKTSLDGVSFIDSQPPHKLYTLIKSSEYWMYPSTYDETYCITALEMMMGGVKLITTDTGNLKYLAEGRASVVNATADDDKLIAEMLSALKDTIDNPDLCAERQHAAERFARSENWFARYQQWAMTIASFN